MKVLMSVSVVFFIFSLNAVGEPMAPSTNGSVGDIAINGLEQNEAVLAGPTRCAFTNGIDSLKRKDIDGNSYFQDVARMDDGNDPLWMKIDNKLRKFNLVESTGDYSHIQNRYQCETLSVTLDLHLQSEKNVDANQESSDYAGTVLVVDGIRKKLINIEGACGP